MRVVFNVVHPADRESGHAVASPSEADRTGLTDKRLAVWSMPTTFFTMSRSSWATCIQTLKAAVRADRNSLPGIAARYVYGSIRTCKDRCQCECPSAFLAIVCCCEARSAFGIGGTGSGTEMAGDFVENAPALAARSTRADPTLWSESCCTTRSTWRGAGPENELVARGRELLFARGSSTEPERRSPWRGPK